jgi:hypothetical protein
MSLGKTHAMWKESVPVTCFPFRYHDREHGTIVQTWAEVKDKLGRDAQSQAIPFCAGHIAPSQLHSNIIAAMCKKEEKNLRRLEELKQLRASSRPSSAPAGGARRAAGTTSVPQTTSEVMAQHVAAKTKALRPGASAADKKNVDEPAPNPVAARPQRPMSAVERRVLTEGDGDGTHGRVAYLRLRKRLPVQHRTNIRRTSSQAYGWEQLDLSEAANAPARQEQALLQAVGHGFTAARRPGPSGVAAEAATVASATIAANRKRVPVPEFTKSSAGGPPAPVSAAVSAAAPPAVAGGAAVPLPQASRVTPIGTTVAAHPSGQREAGQSSYYGRRSYMNQLSRRTGVFSRE